MPAAPPVNPFLASIPWTGDPDFDAGLCPAWAREAVDAMTLPTRGNVFQAVRTRYMALVCMCRGGDRQSGLVFDPNPARGGLVAYRPRDPANVPHWDETFRLLMTLYLKLFPTPTGPAPRGGTSTAPAVFPDDTTRPLKRPTQ